MAENSITVRVYVGSLPFPCGPFTLHGFKASDSITDVKERICQNAPQLGDPDIGIMWSHRHQLEDSETLGSLFSPGCTDWTIYLYYVPNIRKKITKNPNTKEINWLPICKRVRFREEAHEENMGREDDNMGNPVSIVNRPKTIQAPLPFAELSDLRIHGRYDLLDSENRSIPVSRIRFATSVQTPASVILLAPSDEILKDLVDLNTESKYLVVRVFWDKLSYFFLRTLRTSYPDSPIVAVTDLNPHHLDLLTFLDTPPKDLPCCYGWNLSGDFEDVGASNIDFLNIRWLGLRLDDCDGLLLSSFDGSARSPPGFREVIRMLRVNPFLRRKKDWLAALDWLDEFGKSVSFHPQSPADPDDCYLHLGVDFIAKKLSKKDWV